jgi:hypothetical protein
LILSISWAKSSGDTWLIVACSPFSEAGAAFEASLLVGEDLRGGRRPSKFSSRNEEKELDFDWREELCSTLSDILETDDSE